MLYIWIIFCLCAERLYFGKVKCGKAKKKDFNFNILKNCTDFLCI